MKSATCLLPVVPDAITTIDVQSFLACEDDHDLKSLRGWDGYVDEANLSSEESVTVRKWHAGG